MLLVTTTATARFHVFILRGIIGVIRFVLEDAWGHMRGTYLRGPRATSSYGRSGAIKRRSAILLSGTAAIALIAQPASAIVVNDQVAADAGGIEKYFDSTNVLQRRISACAGRRSQ